MAKILGPTIEGLSLLLMNLTLHKYPSNSINPFIFISSIQRTITRASTTTILPYCVQLVPPSCRAVHHFLSSHPRSTHSKLLHHPMLNNYRHFISLSSSLSTLVSLSSSSKCPLLPHHLCQPQPLSLLTNKPVLLYPKLLCDHLPEMLPLKKQSSLLQLNSFFYFYFWHMDPPP